MAVVLGALIFAVLTGGLSLLLIVPLIFVWLGIGVFTEPWQRATPAMTPDAKALPAPEERTSEPTRPRTMTAGRSQRMP